MYLFMAQPGIGHGEMGEVSDSPHYLSHEQEPSDFYQKYKDSDFMPKKGGRNLQNLFDDADVKDYYWFNMSRKYLRER